MAFKHPGPSSRSVDEGGMKSSAHNQPSGTIFDSNHYAFGQSTPIDEYTAMDSSFLSGADSSAHATRQQDLDSKFHDLDLDGNSPRGSGRSRQGSMHSTTSSLRNTYALLDRGILPAGLSSDTHAGTVPSMQGEGDEDSDASHYDDDESNLERAGLFPQHSANAGSLPSPTVPLRRSSVQKSQSPTAVHSDDVSRGNSRNETPLEHNILLDSKTPRTIITDVHHEPMPDWERKRSDEQDEEISPGDDEALPPSEQKQIEQQLTQPGKPRTLKEARALAKERARQRVQARQATEANMKMEESNHNVVGENSVLDLHAPMDSALEQTSPDEAMSELQAKVGEALQDVSFSSSTTGDTSAATVQGPSLHPHNHFSQHPRDAPGLSPLPKEVDGDSNAASATSFDSAREYPSPSHTPGPYAKDLTTETSHEKLADSTYPPVINAPATFHTATAVDPLATPTIQAQGQFVPHAMQTHQRSTAPNKIARLDVYGKTVRWPAAFDPSAIIEQKRLAPWERARSYAHYCNDLHQTPSGLQVWLEMVQRPAQRIAADPSAPLKRHVRGNGTDSSGYAASIRSEATFPMRGDGGKAKEIISHHPTEASIPEYPTDNLPSNLPYPMLASQPSQTGTGTTASTAKHQPRPSLDSSLRDLGTSSNDRQASRNFFSSLGRRGSTRRMGGSGSISISPLTSNASKNNMSVKSKGISLPTALSQSSIASSGAHSPDLFSTPVSSPSAMTPASATPPANTQSLRGPMGPRAPGAPSYSSTSEDRPGLYGLSTSGGLYSVPATSTSKTNLAGNDKGANGNPAERKHSPLITAVSLPSASPVPPGAVKNSLAYGSVRDTGRSTLSPPIGSESPTLASHQSADSHNSATLKKSRSPSFGNLSGRRRSANTVTAEEEETLDKLSDVLPDADRATLLEYLRRAHGNDLVAIGDYLQEQSRAEGGKYLR